MTHDFGEEWAQLKQDALDRRAAEAPMQLAQADGTSPAPGASMGGPPDLGLSDGPIRKKAGDFRVVKSDARDRSRMDDCEAVGRTHSSWAAGAASKDCVGAWQRHLHKLGDRVEEATAGLTKAMDHQISEDGSVAARLRAAGSWLEKA
ncbi:hypothetical protein [Streptomyces lasiicapitis]|uniref:Uncharacterized protein n=1 Tax=Streptomyces lasiicapitis TaxID=1923961 RepID=A0ABQ2LHS6_9ACTN|nr:hypothetical protein [Streptomyces lasiicapitis]GGO34714.1 hypothetical protein GCM10012286_04210 [Streptomyces lasiicapitis]